MSDVEPVEVGLRITAALDYARSLDPDEVREHYLWKLEQISDAVGLVDLMLPELVALAALLIPAHSRVLSGRVPPGEAAPAKLRLVTNPAI